jgi:hypothetical protein
MHFLTAFAFWAQGAWLRLRSKPGFVAAYSAALGAIGDGLYQQIGLGYVDFTVAGVRKLFFAGLGAAIVALMHLYRPTPQDAAAAPNPAPVASSTPEPPKGK